MKYLIPTSDITFKRVFGEHPDLMMSLLNALLPLPDGQEIVRIEYLPAELTPDTPLKKNSIVDVRCYEPDGRQFIVEMQMEWTTNFMQRVLFNASKAYVRQLDRGEHYDILQPVYALSFVNDIFEPEMENYYHYYSLVHNEATGKVIDGLHLVFIELPKFRPTTYSAKKMHVLWLRYLTEISEKTRQAPPELLEDPHVSKALECVQEAAYTPGELYAYEKYWDAVSVERTLTENKYKKGREEGRQEGREEGRQEGLQEGRKEGREEGRTEEKREIARNLKAAGIAPETIAVTTGLPPEEIAAL